MAEGNNDGRTSIGDEFTNNMTEGKTDGQISIGNEFTNVELRKCSPATVSADAA